MNAVAKKSFLVGTAVFAGFVALVAVLFFVATRPNPALTARGATPGKMFVDSVTVAPGTGLFFTWGVTPSPRAKALARGEAHTEAERYGDTYAQARALMTQLTEDLREAGLTLRDVVAVRANLVAEPELDMAGWNKAFGEFFGTATNPHRPARTTLGISRLFHPDYRAEVEFIAAIPPGRGPFAVGSRFERMYDRLHRAETNDRVRSYGRPTWALSTGKAIAPGTALYFQSAIFPDPMIPGMAAMPLKMRMYKGDVGTQAEAIFKKQVAALTEAGLTPADAFFSRNILYPDPKNGGSLDFGAFNKAYSAIYNNPDNPNRLARTVMSAPGYVMQGQLLSIETYAAYPGDTSKLFVGESGKAVATKAFRSDAKAIASSGVATSPAAALTFVSGIIAAERGDMKTEAKAVMELAKARLVAAGVGFDDVVQVRAYLANGSDVIGGVTGWEEVFGATFAGERRPALTSLPVKALANGAKLEVEFLAAKIP
jgi:enamine deaminase RidA (YjgF/YER057c/UK114 family)